MYGAFAYRGNNKFVLSHKKDDKIYKKIVTASNCLEAENLLSDFIADINKKLKQNTK